jgi:PAS domain S-box-containing protein
MKPELSAQCSKGLKPSKVTDVSEEPHGPSPEEKERQYRSVFDTANDALVITNLETGLVVEANPAASKMHGYTSEEFIGLPLIAFIHQDSQRAFSEYVQAVRSGSVFDTRALHIQRDGSTRP